MKVAACAKWAGLSLLSAIAAGSCTGTGMAQDHPTTSASAIVPLYAADAIPARDHSPQARVAHAAADMAAANHLRLA